MGRTFSNCRYYDVHITLRMAYYDFWVFIKVSSPITEKFVRTFYKDESIFLPVKSHGDLMAHATNDIQAIQQTAGAGVLTLVDSLAVGDVYS